jgi:hypothetical protein
MVLSASAGKDLNTAGKEHIGRAIFIREDSWIKNL